MIGFGWLLWPWSGTSSFSSAFIILVLVRRYRLFVFSSWFRFPFPFLVVGFSCGRIWQC